MRTIRRIPRKRHLSPRERFISVLRGGSLPETKPLPLFRRREFIYPLMMVFLIMLLAFVAKNMLPVQNQSNQTAVSQPAAEQPTPGQVESSPSAENPAVTRQPAVSPTPGGNETMSYEDAKKIFGGNH